MRRLVLALAVVGAGMALVRCSRAAARPNVVLIILDTLRSDALGCYDETNADLSPEIDRLAARGAKFLDVTSQSSWTRPSVASLLTATDPRNLGIYVEEYDTLPAGFVTLAEALHGAGYETVGITANPNLNKVFNFHQGFDTYFESAAVWSWMQPESGQERVQRTRPVPDSQSVLQRMLDHARSRASARPLYMQILLMEVHEGWKLVRPEFQKNIRGLVGPSRGYWDGVRQASFDVGRFVDQMAALPGGDNTLFVITSDHGEGLEDHPAVAASRGHGLLLYRSQVKVPLILYTPADKVAPSSANRRRQLLRPQEIDEPVRLMDLMPTVLDYLGIAAPEGIDGRSLLPLLDARRPAGLPSYFVTETHYGGSHKLALYSGDWAYIENREAHDGVNAFELQARGTRENGRLTDQIEEQPSVRRRLAGYLHQWEERFPKRPSTQPGRVPSNEILEQLRALGYVR